MSPGLLNRRLLEESVMHAESDKERLLFAALLEARHSLLSILKSFRFAPEAAEDVLHNALLVTLRNIDVIRDFRAFLIALTYRCCIHHRRALTKALKYESDPHQGLDSVPQGEVPQERVEMRRDIDRLLTRLPRNERYVLKYWAHGCENHEIAARVGISRTSIRKMRNRGTRRMRSGFASNHCRVKT